MQLLIVDDERIIVEDLKTSVNWQKLGITRVFAANSMSRAKEIFTRIKIDIMICDIEMPQGSGLELLSWVRDNYPKTESIFLSCHTDFSYAKEAIRLGSLDYIVKPALAPELEAVVGKAIEKINLDCKLLEKSRFSEFWFKHQPLIVERFWINVLDRTIPSNEASIKKAAETWNIPYVEQMKFIPVLISIRRWHTDWNLHDQKLMEFAVKNVAGETVIKEGANGQLVEVGRGEFLAILSLWNYPNFSRAALKEDCKTFIASCCSLLNCDISCYIGDEALAFEMPEMADRLREICKNNVAYDNEVFFLTSSIKSAPLSKIPDMELWIVLLTEGAYDRLLSEIGSYLRKRMQEARLDAGMLKQFHQSLMQMIYSSLTKRDIQAHQLFNDTESQKLYDNAINSVTDLLKWVGHVAKKVSAVAGYMESSASVVEKAKKYIRDNIDQKITRKDIADSVFLCPDYLDRLFKKETGLTVTKYLDRERMQNAQLLLAKTQIPISEIAASNGYVNFSHFSRALKKYTSLKPKDFRKKSSQNVN